MEGTVGMELGRDDKEQWGSSWVMVGWGRLGGRDRNAYKNRRALVEESEARLWMGEGQMQ